MSARDLLPEDDEWAPALASWRAGKPEHLAHLLRSGWPLTPHARDALARIATGEDRPDRRGRPAKLEGLALDEARFLVARLREERDRRLVELEEIADALRIEPEQARRRVEDWHRQHMQQIAASFDVSARTLEDAVKPSAGK